MRSLALWLTGFAVASLTSLSDAPAQDTHVPYVQLASNGGVRLVQTASVDSPHATGDQPSRPLATAEDGADSNASPGGAFPASVFPSLSSSSETDDAGEKAKRSGNLNEMSGPAITVASSLAVVLGLFAALVWVTRKFGSRGNHGGAIPKEVLHCLGSASIDPRTRLMLVRCGNRILVLAQNASGTQPISEITDPEEVRSLTAACQGNSRQEFASALRSIEREPAQSGYVGAPVTPRQPSHGQQLFATA